MKEISTAVIRSVFGVFISCFKQVQGLSKKDKPWQEWLIFIIFMGMTFAVLWFGFSASIDLITGSHDLIPEVIHK